LEKYESIQVFERQFEHDQNNPNDWEKFEDYRKSLNEFKKGVYKMLVSLDFCTHEDIKEFYDWSHYKGKYKKEKQ